MSRVKSKKWRPVVMMIIIMTALSMISLGGIYGSPNIQNTRDLEDLRDIAHIDCVGDHENAPMHIHPRLEIVINGAGELIPEGIGVEPGCVREIHTQDDTGTLHVASHDLDKYFTLGDFFAVAGVPFSRDEFLGLFVGGSNILLMFVNGEPSDAFGDLILEDGQEIRIEYLDILEGEGGAPVESNDEIPPEIMEELMRQMEEAEEDGE